MPEEIKAVETGANTATTQSEQTGANNGNGADDASHTTDTEKDFIKEFGISKRDDEQFEWKADPEDANSSVYVGKTIAELKSNIAKGITEKDKYFREIKARESIKSPSSDKSHDDGMSDDDIQKLLPNRDAIYQANFKPKGLELAMVNWSEDDWAKYQDEKSLRDWQIARLQRDVDTASKASEQQYDEASVDFVNADQIRKATDNVRGFLVKRGLDPEKYGDTYDRILKEVWGDKGNMNRKGVLISGRIETAFADALMSEVLKERTEKTEVQKRLEQEAKRLKEQKGKIKDGGESGGKFTEQSKTPTSVLGAKESAREALRSGLL